MKIQDILNQVKPCWKYAAMDSDFSWYLFTEKPFPHKAGVWMTRGEGRAPSVDRTLDIEPFDGDWKDSLICREERRL